MANSKGERFISRKGQVEFLGKDPNSLPPKPELNLDKYKKFSSESTKTPTKAGHRK